MNADASVLLTVVRKDRPDGKRIYRKPRGIKKPSRGYPLLDLPSLIATPERPLLVVEGEKTAEAARHLFGDRYATTTAIGGAGKAHQTDWSPAKDREVVIWPDADEVGRHHAEQVAEQCVKAAAGRDLSRDKVRQIAANATGFFPFWPSGRGRNCRCPRTTIAMS